MITPPFTRTWWFSILILAGVIVIIYLIYRYRVAQLEKLNQVRLSIARDLHDDMGADLSQIKILSELEASRQGSHPVFKKINDRLSQIMANMSEIVWSINPEKDDIKEVILHIQEYAIETLEPLGIELHFKVDPLPSHARFNISQRRHFNLLFKEAINNISKYAMASEVIFTVHFLKGMVMARISDDGCGFDPQLVSQGNGLKNMKQRVVLLGGTLTIDTTPEGTHVGVVVPLTRKIA